MEIKEKITKNIKDHIVEVEGCELELEKLNKAKKTLDTAQKIMVYKDKMLFHKACVLCLNQLKEELQQEGKI